MTCVNSGVWPYCHSHDCAVRGQTGKVIRRDIPPETPGDVTRTLSSSTTARTYSFRSASDASTRCAPGKTVSSVSSPFLFGPGLAERGEEDTRLTWISRLSPYAAANSSATTWTNCSWSTAAENSRRFLTGEGTDATPLVTIEPYSDMRARERGGKGTFFFVSPESEDAHTLSGLGKQDRGGGGNVPADCRARLGGHPVWHQSASSRGGTPAC